jgi:hypothetical protein
MVSGCSRVSRETARDMALEPMLCLVSPVRKHASAMREACGYTPLSNQRILADVATNTGISMSLTAIDLGLGSDVARVQANSSN